MSKARGLADLGNAYSDGALSNRNLIINGAMQVAQRGTSFTNYSGFTLDRWYNANPSTNTITQSFDAALGMSYMGVTQSSGYGTYTRIEDKDVMHLRAGDVITLSYWMDSEDGNVRFRPIGQPEAASTTTTIETSGTWFRRSATHTMTATEVATIATGVGYQINIEPATNAYKLTGVQLERGDTATPFEHRSIGQELALCQRYYRQMQIKIGCLPWANSNGGWHGESRSFDPVMRAAPSVTQMITPTYSGSITTVPASNTSSSSGVNVIASTTADRVLIGNHVSQGTIFAVVTNNAYDAEL